MTMKSLVRVRTLFKNRGKNYKYRQTMSISVVPYPPVPFGRLPHMLAEFKPIHPWTHSSCWPPMITVLLLLLQITMLLNNYCVN